MQSISKALEWKYRQDVPGDWKLSLKVSFFVWGVKVDLVFAGRFDVQVSSFESKTEFSEIFSPTEWRELGMSGKNAKADFKFGKRCYYADLVGFAKRSLVAKSFIEETFKRVVLDGVVAANSERSNLEIDDVLKLVLEWTVATGEEGEEEKSRRF